MIVNNIELQEPKLNNDKFGLKHKTDDFMVYIIGNDLFEDDTPMGYEIENLYDLIVLLNYHCGYITDDEMNTL